MTPSRKGDQFVMCVFSKPKAPPPVQIPTPAAAPAPVDEGAKQALDASKQSRKKLAASQEASTIVTGGQGLTSPANTTTKQLFGQ